MSDTLWTFSPDDDEQAAAPEPPSTRRRSARPPRAPRTPRAPRPPRVHAGLVPRVGLVVAAGAALTLALVVAGVGPFHHAPPPAPGAAAGRLGGAGTTTVGTTPSTTAAAGPAPSTSGTSTTVPGTTAPTPLDVVGTWNLLLTYRLSFVPERLVVTTESSTGAFSGSVAAVVGTASVQGQVTGAGAAFVITLGSSTETCTATLATVDGALRMTGTFKNGAGSGGGISAIRVGG